ncbi:MAG: alternative ribosome rescue aminoacyl-tRNA hydrolase ArfB [Planctomycetota bacterium]|jgi:ribosome-associated protein
MIEIKDGISICEDEFIFRASRSRGPGGQNVNKVNTRITLFFDVANCPGLSENQKRRILKQLKTRIDKNGVLRVASQRHRTQKANRQAAQQRLVELLAAALTKKPIRKKTRVPASAVRRRLEEKKQRSRLKQQQYAAD